MLNTKLVIQILGALLLIEGVLILLTGGVDLIYEEGVLRYFVVSSCVEMSVGGILMFLGRGAQNDMKRRDGFFIVTMAWVLFSLFGMLPFYLSKSIPTITDSFFETVSGFTTTGTSILNNIEEIPHALLFWRSLIQWIGGLGMIFFTIAVLPIFGSGGVQLFAAETTGISHDKIHPRIGITAKWIWIIYFSITIAEAVLLYVCGMDLFDSLCHSFATTATGGFSTKQASIMYYSSPAIQYIISFFMILAGVNFTLIYLVAFKGKIRQVCNDTELRYYLVIMGYFVFSITGILYFYNDYSLEEAFRKSLFQVASIQSTTGFTTDDYMLWPSFAWLLLLILMFVGACGGSTTGSIKCVRIAVLCKVLKNEFNRMLHPSAVLPVKINGHVLPNQVVMSALAFILFFLIITAIGTFVIAGAGIEPLEAFSIAATSMGNVGPGVGAYGPAYCWAALPDPIKWFSAILMLVGRLEIFTVLLLFAPSFWKKF